MNTFSQATTPPIPRTRRIVEVSSLATADSRRFAERRSPIPLLTEGQGESFSPMPRMTRDESEALAVWGE